MRTTLTWNLVLALAWCAIAGELTVLQFAVGFGIAYLVLGWLRPTDDARAYVRRVPRLLRFAGIYAVEVFQSALRVAWDVVTPSSRRRPAIFAVPLEARTDEEITLLSNLITFTPGSLALDVTPDRRALLVHGMFVPDPDAARAHVKRLEAWVLRILR